MSRKNAFYAQSGVASRRSSMPPRLCGCRDLRASTAARSAKVYAGRDGIVGALTEDLIDTSKESAAAIRALKYTPSGRLRLVPLQAQGLRGKTAPSTSA